MSSFEFSPTAVPVLKAASEGDLVTVKKCVGFNRSFLEANNYGYTPLQLVSFRGLKAHLQVARWLIGAGANLEAKARNWFTVLHLASIEGHLVVVKSLVEAGANVNALDEAGRTPRLLAFSPEVSQYLMVAEHLEQGTQYLADMYRVRWTDFSICIQ